MSSDRWSLPSIGGCLCPFDGEVTGGGGGAGDLLPSSLTFVDEVAGDALAGALRLFPLPPFFAGALLPDADDAGELFLLDAAASFFWNVIRYDVIQKSS